MNSYTTAEAKKAKVYRRRTEVQYGSEKLSCRFYLSDYILPGLNKLGLLQSSTERRALELFRQLCADPRNHISFKMQAGDIVFYSNNTILHARKSFISSKDQLSDRLLHRVWINPFHKRSFPEGFAKYRFGYDNQS